MLLCLWVRVDQRLVFEMERPPFLTPLAGFCGWVHVEIDLDARRDILTSNVYLISSDAMVTGTLGGSHKATHAAMFNWPPW
jgi:hypothetical protein